MTNKAKILFFGANWFPHCREFKKTWDKLKKDFSEGEIKFLHVDLVKLPKWGEKFKVGGIPDIRIYHEGELGQYAGKRDYNTMKKYLKKLIK